MIDFSIPTETQMILDSLRRFIQTELKPHEEEVEATEVVRPELARELRDKAKAIGLFALGMPEDVGGGGLSAVDMCLCEEEFGFTKDALVRRAFGAIPMSLLNCQGEQREKYLLPAVAGDINVALGMTEPNAGSDAAGIKTRARASGGDWVLDGSKHFISDADVADAFIITAVTDPTKGAKGISAFLVDKDTPGFKLGRLQYMMGLRATNHFELILDNVRLPASQMLGPEGSGLFQALSTLNRVRLGMVGGRSVGMARKLMQMCIDYASERSQFGQKIGEFQMVQAMLADMATEIYAARLMVLNAAWEVDQGLDPREKVSMVKYYASETLGRVADKAVQIFGGMGYCREMPIEQMYRDARVYRIFDGASDIHRSVIARAMLKNGRQVL
ncbi:acyl-CoA dehydrogenase family protein [Acidovorax facilis]|jgi:acyl-CoA dehydrogenase|uniref:acyl-CoA dehydrogenase family protein n=1 Tax=Acidovorax facilis TaxID=12917 RepID=UPI003D65536C